MATIIDSYSESNYVSSAYALTVSGAIEGQSFTGDGGVLNSAKFHLYRNGTISGSIGALIYTHAGTFGTSSVPSSGGDIIAQSGVLNIEDMPTDVGLVTFTFTGVDKITLTNGTKYCVALATEYDVEPGMGNAIYLSIDTTSPSHAGNIFYSIDGGTNFTADNTSDTIFYVYKDDVGVTGPFPTFLPS